MARMMFAYGNLKAWPASFAVRTGFYLPVCILAWIVPPWGAAGALAATALFGALSGVNWLKWLLKLRWFWIVLMSPVVISLIWNDPVFPLKNAFGRSMTILTIVAASHWLTGTTTVFEIKRAVEIVCRPLGKKAAGLISLVASLALAFVPWLLDEVQATRDAAIVRGADPRRRPFSFLKATTIPVLLRVIERARHTAEALELRGAG